MSAALLCILLYSESGIINHFLVSSQNSLLVSGCNVTAVASTSLARSKEFARHFSIPTYYTTYEALASDPNVDIVYIATTNNNHKNPTLLMLRNNKNVLVEKPTTVTYEDAVIMYREARERGLFLMTNHWTRFFPLIQYLRRTFLTTPYSNNNNNYDPERRFLKQQTNEHNLGKVMAMKGDFSFVTPLSPSDRFLNHSLGGGVTLDIGCYLIELALLAAYDHHNTTSLHHEMKKEVAAATANNIHPDGIEATGHGIMFNGVEFPVDVESSFSLRWGGGNYGVWNGECPSNNETECDTISIGGEGTKTLKHNNNADLEHKFSMIASFQASFRRPSTFEVEYVFEHGRIVIAGPGNCPSEMTIYEYEQYGPLKRETVVLFPLPSIKNELVKRYGTPFYPRAEGFVYVIDAIEKCMAEKGVPGSGSTSRGEEEQWMMDEGCLEMPENTMEEQLVTVEVTENVLKEMGYFD